MHARSARTVATALTFSALSAALAACSVNTDKTAPSAKPTPTADGGAAAKSKPKKQAKPGALASLAKPTPPAGSTSQGTKSNPSAGGSIIPIVGVEVYLVTVDVDDDGVDDALSWAHTEDGITYLWAEGPVTCADGLSDGTGGFVAAIGPDGSGAYLFALDSCPEQNLFGCSFDSEGSETACGVCAWDAQTIACVSAE